MLVTSEWQNKVTAKLDRNRIFRTAASMTWIPAFAEMTGFQYIIRVSHTREGGYPGRNSSDELRYNNESYLYHTPVLWRHRIGQNLD
ncbi:hypothetical protein JCM31598_09580 [Desulfonatronum parangueonense]